MEYVYAAMLLYKAGKDITEDAVTAIVKAAGVTVDAAKVKALVAALDGVDMEEAINTAAVAAAPVAAATAGDAPAAEAKAEEPKEEEPKEEEAAAGLGALFG